MKKILLAVLVMAALVAALGLAACSSSEEAPADEATEAATDEGAVDEAVDAKIDGGAYGYAGEDPAEAAVYQYLVEEVSKNFDEADVSIPTVSIVNVDYTNPDEILVAGDFWIDNYVVEGDTLDLPSIDGEHRIVRDGRAGGQGQHAEEYQDLFHTIGFSDGKLESLSRKRKSSRRIGQNLQEIDGYRDKMIKLPPSNPHRIGYDEENRNYSGDARRPQPDAWRPAAQARSRPQERRPGKDREAPRTHCH